MLKTLMASPKTTVIGICAALGLAAQGLQGDASWMEFAIAIAVALMGIFARDNDVSSEKANAK